MRYNYLIECVDGKSTKIKNIEDIDFDMSIPCVVINDEIKKEKTIINMKNVIRIIRKEVGDE